jgi:hypothetical protein
MSATAAIAAQSAPAMSKAAKRETMRTTYTGCVESVNPGGAFVLTNANRVGAASMHRDMAMKHQETMADAARTMPHEPAQMAEDGLDGTASQSFALAGSVNFSKHVGHKVSVTGSLSAVSTEAIPQGKPTFTVKALKVIGKSCS